METLTMPIASGADHRSNQYRIVQIAGTLATTALNGRGILQNKPNTNEDATIAVIGRSKAIAGGTLTAGAHLAVTSGGFVTAAVSGGVFCGFAEVAASSGSAVWGQFNFANLGYLNA